MTDLISGAALRHYAPLVQSLGGDPDRLLLRLGISPSAAGDNKLLLPYSAVAAAIGDAAIELDRADFGLSLAARQSIDILGPVAVVIRNAETVAAAIESACRYLSLCAPPERAMIERRLSTAVYSFEIAERQIIHRNHVVEKSLGLALGALRLVIGNHFTPIRVMMRHSPLSSFSRYREFFGCPVQFNASINGICFPVSLLEAAIDGRDAVALALAQKHLGDVRPDLPLATHVRETIHRLIGIGHAGLTSVADVLSIHPRVLQRRLADEGASFEDILDDVRRTLAWQLSDTGLPIGEIASRLGYSEQSSYTRACRRWHGVSPRQLVEHRCSAGLSKSATADMGHGTIGYLL